MYDSPEWSGACVHAVRRLSGGQRKFRERSGGGPRDRPSQEERGPFVGVRGTCRPSRRKRIKQQQQWMSQLHKTGCYTAAPASPTAAATVHAAATATRADQSVHLQQILLQGHLSTHAAVSGAGRQLFTPPAPQAADIAPGVVDFRTVCFIPLPAARDTIKTTPVQKATTACCKAHCCVAHSRSSESKQQLGWEWYCNLQCLLGCS